MIADYAFYEGVYHGDVLTPGDFPKYAGRADAWLDESTLGRATSSGLPECCLSAVKKAECAVADALRMADPAAADRDPAVQKETVGDCSVTFRPAAELDAETRARIAGIITRFLGHTGLMFRGIPAAGRNGCTVRIP